MTTTIDLQKAVQWFEDRKGQLTYSMTGSRNGADGTADCSGSVVQALYEAGASKPAYLYSTETIHAWLIANGFVLIAKDEDFIGKYGDVVVWGQQGVSGGSGGHVGLITSDDPNATFVSACYYTESETGTAIQEFDYNWYWNLDGQPYNYVYRYQGTQSQAITDKVESISTPSAIEQLQNADNAYTAAGEFVIDKVREVSGVDVDNPTRKVWLALPKSLGGSNPNFIDNGIPLPLLDAVGTDDPTKFKEGQKARFKSDYQEGTIDDYDIATNGAAVVFDDDTVGEWEVWFDADQLLAL